MSSFLVRTATGPGLTTRPNTRPGHTTRLTNRPGHTTRLNTRPGHTTRRKGMYQQRLTVRRLRLLGICIFGPMLASAMEVQAPPVDQHDAPFQERAKVPTLEDRPSVVQEEAIVQDVQIHMKKNSYISSKKSWTLQTDTKSEATCVFITKGKGKPAVPIKGKYLYIPHTASDEMKVKISFDDLVESRHYYYEIEMLDKTGKSFTMEYPFGATQDKGGKWVTAGNSSDDDIKFTTALPDGWIECVSMTNGDHFDKILYYDEKTNNGSWTKPMGANGKVSEHSLTITIGSLKNMTHLVVRSYKRGETELTSPCKGLKPNNRLNKLIRKFTYGQKFPIIVMEKPEETDTLATDPNRRRLGWKPSQDMDWSPDYRQRRR